MNKPFSLAELVCLLAFAACFIAAFLLLPGGP